MARPSLFGVTLAKVATRVEPEILAVLDRVAHERRVSRGKVVRDLLRGAVRAIEVERAREVGR